VNSTRLVVVSDIHYAGAAERARIGFEHRAVPDLPTRLLLRAYRKFVWLEEPTAHAHMLDTFLGRAGEPDLVVANGDFSCDSAFVGVSDDAARASAAECLAKLRSRFGSRFAATIGDHELGKTSLAGNRGGMRLASWHHAVGELGLEPLWTREAGRHVLIGLTSTLIGLPVFQRDMLEAELAGWQRLREEHLDAVRRVFDSVPRDRRIILFCHDPTALPFLHDEPAVRARLPQFEQTIIGHMHSEFFMWQSRVLAGMPVVGFCGKSIRRYSVALNRARLWRPFRVKLCPSLTGIQLFKDGGFLEAELPPRDGDPVKFRLHRLPWTQPGARLG